MQAQEGDAQGLDAANSCEGKVNRRRCSRAREGGYIFWLWYCIGGRCKGLESDHQRATTAPTQHSGSSLTSPQIRPTGSCYHKPAEGCLASEDHTQDGGNGDGETDEFKLDAAGVAAEEAVERKEARRVRPWLSEWQELAAGQLGWGGGVGGNQDTDIVWGWCWRESRHGHSLCCDFEGECKAGAGPTARCHVGQPRNRQSGKVE
jgi:hypothetical protein